MSKVKIDAREILQDIRDGMKDSALMEKDRLSARGLQSLFSKLVEADLIKQADLDARMTAYEKTVKLMVFKCPACGMPQFSEFDECPQCGIIVSKYQKLKQKPSEAPDTLVYERRKPESSPVEAEKTVSAEVTYRGNLQRTGHYTGDAVG